MSHKETNILKAFGIVLMFFHHLFYERVNFQDYEIRFLLFMESRVVSLALMFKVCVAIFVFATAYGTTKSLNVKQKNGEIKISEYAIGRYFKLMFGFWFIWILAQATSFIGDRYLIYGDDMRRRIKYMVIDFFASANLLGTPTLNATWWYMSFAILLVFFVPIIWFAVKRLGVGAIMLAIYLPCLMGHNTSSSMNFYLFTIVIGILSAEYNWLEKIREYAKSSLLKRILIILGCSGMLLALIYARKFAVSTIIVSIYDGMFSLILAALCVMISDIPAISQGLEFIGKHSMNMFLTHTFIKAYYFQDFSYRWKYPVLILIVLVVDTLLLSVVIEWIKKIIGYNRFADYVTNKAKCAIGRIRG